MLTSQNPRIVSLRWARFQIALSAAMAVICAACLVFSAVLVLDGHPALLLIAPALGLVFSAGRTRRWHRAVRRALVSPDAMHWSP